MSVIYINDAWVEADTAQTSVDNSIFNSGLGFYQTLICRGNEPFFWREHYELILSSMSALHFNTEVFPRGYELRRKIELLVSRNHYPPFSRIKITVWQPSSDNEQVRWSLSLEKLTVHPYNFNPQGLIANVYYDCRKMASPFSHANTCSVLKAMAKKAQLSNRWDTTLILNGDNNIIETIDSNIYVVAKDKVYTPSLQSGATANAIHNMICEACKNVGYQVMFLDGISASFLRTADEAFIASAAYGITPLLGFEQQRFYINMVKDVVDYVKNKLIF